VKCLDALVKEEISMMDSRTEKVKMLVGGASYGLHNIGDEAILESIIESFIDIMDIDIISFGSEWVDTKFPCVKRHKLRTIYTKPKLGLIASPRRKIFSAIRESFFPDMTPYTGKHLFLCGGGTLLSDCPWQALHMIELAAKRGTPSVIWGAGMAEIMDNETIVFLRQTLNSDNVLHVYVRDEYVQQRLIRYGIESGKVSVCYDPAYRLKADCCSGLAELTDVQKKVLFNGRPNICVSLSYEPDVSDRNHIIAIREFIRTAAVANNIFLIPTGFGTACNDRDIMKKMVCDENVVFIDRELSPSQLMGILTHMKLVVSSRLHMSIFGVNVGVPSINLIRNEKQEDFSKLFGFPAFKMDTLTSYILCTEAEKMMSDSMISEKIRMQHKELCETYDACCKEVVEKYVKKRECI